MAQLDIQLKRLTAFRALTLRFTPESHLHFARITAEIRSTLIARAIRGTGYPIHILYANEYHHEQMDSEFAIPVSDDSIEAVALPVSGTMTVREFAAVDAATYTHSGTPETLTEYSHDLHQWIAEHGYQLTGSMRLVYVRGILERLPVEEWVFEIHHPVETNLNHVI